MRCRKCGSEKMGVMPNKKNPAATDLYCLECGAWQKFATRDEIRLYQTRKFVTTNADHIRAMTDEELAEWLENVDCFNCECCIYQMACRFEHDTETVYYADKYDCRVGRMDWLKQPYKACKEEV